MQDNKMAMKILEFVMIRKGEELYDYDLISREEARDTYRTWTIVSIDKSFAWENIQKFICLYQTKKCTSKLSS